MNKEWFTAAELAGLPGLPGTDRRTRAMADRQGWAGRKRQARGGGQEYHLSSLPAETQSVLLLSGEHSAASPPADPEPGSDKSHYDKQSLWANWERKTQKQREKSQQRVLVIEAALAMIGNGVARTQAFTQTAATHGCNRATLYRWYESVRPYDREDWPAVLVPGHVGRTATAECSEEAWEFFKADFLRLEKPASTACYHRLKRTADARGWVVPSRATLERRLQREVPRSIQVLMRDGEHALLRLYPALERTVRDLHAMEWINGDGYQHNVFVRWPNGDIARPKTWVWQDVYSRRLLSWRTDQTENTDVLRLSFGELIEAYGIPRHATIDNTRAAANKWMTGGVPNRYRFKVKDDDPLGIMTILGIKVHWTSVFKGKGHGQAKPVERMFGVGGLGEYVDKDPAFAGAYTGNNPNAKPENYGSTAIPLETFLQVLDDRLAAFNAMTGRRTEICNGLLSFDQAFEQSYAQSTIRMATEEQRRLWLLAAEAIKVRSDGSIVLQAGGINGGGKNRYRSDGLIEYGGQKVVVRFDPQQLHQDVSVYRLDGRFITQAECIQAAGFGDFTTGREVNRARKRYLKATKEAAAMLKKMDVIKAAELMPQTPAPDPSHPNVVEGVFQPRKMVVNGGHLEAPPDEATESYEDSFMNVTSLMREAIHKRHEEKV